MCGLCTVTAADCEAWIRSIDCYDSPEGYCSLEKLQADNTELPFDPEAAVGSVAGGLGVQHHTPLVVESQGSS